MGLVSVLLFDSTPAWNKRRLLYVKLLTPLPYPATGEPQLLRKFRATFSKKPSPEHPVSARPKCQAQLVAYGRWSRSRVQT